MAEPPKSEDNTADEYALASKLLDDETTEEDALLKYEEAPIETEGKWIEWHVLWAYTGPGWLMSMAYLDPGNLESDLQAGAYAGYQLLWVLLWSTIMGLVLQVLSARLGVVTGKNLAQMCRAQYPRPISNLLWIMTEIAIIGSDIQEVVGSAIAFKILTGLPLWAGCLVTGLDTFTFLGLQQFGQRKLEAFFASLIFIMAVCFWMNYALDQPPSGDVAFGTFVPTAAEYTLVQAVGILGAVIMPHNIYLHSALVQSRKVDRTNERAVATANKYNAIESSIALAVSFVINLAVVGVFAHAFFDKGCAEQGLACVPLTTAGVDLDDDSANACMVGAGKGVCNAIGLSKAGDALKSSLGAGARIVWAVGVLAAGQASTMTGTLAGQYVMDGFLELKIPAWQRVLVTRCIALGPAIAVALGTGDSDVLDEWLNVLQSVQLPFALLPVLHFTSRQDLMGSHANSITTKLVCWALAVVVIITNFYLTGAQVIGGDKEPSYFYAISVILALLYLAFIAFLVKSDFLTFLAYAKTKIF